MQRRPWSKKLISLYWDGKFSELPQKFLDCLKACKDKNLPIHIGGDFNSHHTLWGGRRDTRRGDLIQWIMVEYGLVILNEGDVPTFQNANGSSVIDLTLTSVECIEYISSWGVIQKPNGSDHNTIETRYFTQAPEKVFRRSMKDVDWPAFRSKLAAKMRNWTIPRTMDRNALDGYVRDWNRMVGEVCEEFSKLHVVAPREPIINLWYTKELDQERKSVFDLGRKAVRTKSQADWDAFHAASREYSVNLRKAARACFQKFANEIPDLAEMARFCKMVKRQPRHDVGVMLRPDGDFTSTPREALNIVMDSAFPDSVQVQPHHQHVVRLENDTKGDFTYPEYDWAEDGLIRDSFNRFKNSKSPGPDLFKPRMLKHLPDVAISRLRQLFEASFFSGYVPQDWLKSKVVFLSKPGKSNYSLASSFRPICLTSFVFKCMERLVYWDLLETSLKEVPLNEKQHGFRKGKSPDTALSMLVGKLEKALARRKGVAIGVFLDIRGAFDNVDINFTTNALLERGFDPQMVRWYSHYLGNRVATATIRGVSVRRLLKKGVPQGGILSPLIWNCNID